MDGQLFRTINYHLKKVFADSELQEDSVVRNFRMTAADGIAKPREPILTLARQGKPAEQAPNDSADHLSSTG